MRRAGADWLHFDVMDGHFVPNISVGPLGVQAAKRAAPDMVLDVHLMISEPDRYIKDFVDAGADILTVHVEAPRHIHRTLQRLRAAGLGRWADAESRNATFGNRGFAPGSGYAACHERESRLWRAKIYPDLPGSDSAREGNGSGEGVAGLYDRGRWWRHPRKRSANTRGGSGGAGGRLRRIRVRRLCGGHTRNQGRVSGLYAVDTSRIKSL